MTKNRGFYRLCAWCPDSRAKTRDLEAQGWQVTHGCCPLHYLKATGEVYLGEFKEGPIEESK